MSVGSEVYRALHPVLSRLSDPAAYPVSYNAGMVAGGASTLTYSAVDAQPIFEQGQQPQEVTHRPIWLHSLEVIFSAGPSHILDIEIIDAPTNRLVWSAQGILFHSGVTGAGVSQVSTLFPFSPPEYVYDESANGRLRIELINRSPTTTPTWAVVITYSTSVF